MGEAALELDSSSSADPQDVITEQSSSSDVPESMEDAIRDVLQQPEASDSQDDYEEAEPEVSAEADPSPAEEVEGDPEQGEPEPVGMSDEEFIQQLKDNDVPLGKIERFQELINDRNEARDGRAELQGVQDQLGQIQVAGQQAGLSQEQMTTLFSLPVMMANDPKAAVEALQQLQQFAGTAAGTSIPDDLQKKVDDGYMDEASAKELAGSRAENERINRQSDQEREQDQERQARESQGSIVDAVNTYQTTLKESDPDYDHKHNFVKRELSGMVRERGAPKNPEEAVAWAKEAHEAVTKELGFMKPKPTEKRTLSGRRTNRPTTAAPTTMAEAINAAVGNVTEE